MDIKIFMCCHNKIIYTPPFCIPIQGGAKINPPLKGAAPDTGEKGGISHKNREYCELTVQYYAWKNAEADYYGFCHYRRFFCFDSKVKKPYLAKKMLSRREREKYLKTENEIREIIKDYDIIAPRSENVGHSIRAYYPLSSRQYPEDLELFVKIAEEKYPELKKAAEEYLNGNGHYFCNMFIMKKACFNEYCSMLFGILEEFDKLKTPHGSFQSDRTNGYLGERFFGIYLTYVRKKGASVLELPRIDINCPLKKRILYHLLPPESKLRLYIKTSSGR